MNSIILFAIVSWLPGVFFQDVKSDETIIFYPTEGWRVDEGRAWEIHIHGWIFEVEWRRNLLGPLYDALDLDEEDESEDDHDEDDDIDPRRDIFVKRASPFLVDNQGGKRIEIKIGITNFVLPLSAPDGHFEGTVRLASADIDALRKSGELRDDWLTYRTVLRKSDHRIFEGRVHLIDDIGISVVSDIDDTIKITHVTNRKHMLRHTFLLPFEAVAGMPELYTDWSRRPDVVFHYVSSSPWQLFEPLRDFLEPPQFPAATFHLRRVRLKGMELIAAIKSDGGHKTHALKILFERYPRRQFVLIGDAGERDPEIYCQLALEHPRQVAGIFIRDADRDETSRRYRTLFERLPPGMAVVFHDPEQLVELLPGSVATSRPATSRPGPGT